MGFESLVEFFGVRAVLLAKVRYRVCMQALRLHPRLEQTSIAFYLDLRATCTRPLSLMLGLASPVEFTGMSACCPILWDMYVLAVIKKVKLIGADTRDCTRSVHCASP